MAVGIGLATAPKDMFYANHSTPVYTPGQTYFADPATDNAYLYVKVTTGSSTANLPWPGRAVYWDQRELGTTRTDTGGTDKAFCGLMIGAPVYVSGTASTSASALMTSGNYCWVQVKGIAQALMTSALTLNSPLITGTNFLAIASAATDVPVGTNLVAGRAPGITVGITPAILLPVMSVGTAMGGGTLSSITVLQSGDGYSSTPFVGIIGGGLPDNTATATATRSSNTIASIALGGTLSGFTSTPTLVIGTTKTMLYGTLA